MPAVTNAQIQAAPDEVIRATLIALCDHDADLRERVTGVFRLAASAVKKKHKADNASDGQELPGAKRQKRKANDAADKPQKLEGLHVCIMCETAYLESENTGDVCWHHPQEADASKYVEDQYTYYHRDLMDFDETPETMPEAFRYPCCDEQFEESAGCRWGRHYATTEERDNDPMRKDWPSSEDEGSKSE